MKLSKLAVISGVLIVLVLATLWKNSFTETHGVTAGSDLKIHSPASTAAPLVDANHLVLVEFFAGY